MIQVTWAIKNNGDPVDGVKVRQLSDDDPSGMYHTLFLDQEESFDLYVELRKLGVGVVNG